MKDLHPDQDGVKERVLELAGKKIYSKIEIVEDTTDYMNVYSGNILKLADRELFILGDINEPRFGMQDQPKYWVKKTLDLDSGEIKVVKLVFHEEFTANIGSIRIPCFRSPEKEASVLALTREDDRFMHGSSAFDVKGNVVRIIDWIYGDNIYNRVMNLDMDHENYFQNLFPEIPENLIECIDAIQFLHGYGLCHGDIRNDHIYIEEGSGLYRWIDFDLTQNFSDFDDWSLGNVIQFCTGMGKLTFHNVKKSNDFSDSVKASLNSDDGAAFLKYRIMNLSKVYGYVPKRLNDVLMHFSSGTTVFYDKASQIRDDLKEVLEIDFAHRPR